MVNKVTKAVIPVAGLGTRMLPATKAIPKELLPVYDRPIIEHVVKEAISAGITEIILVTRSGKEAIENHFDAHYELEHRLEKKGKETILGSVKNILPGHVKVTSIRQADAMGLGHAVLCAKHLIGEEPFAVLLPDVLVVDDESRDRNHSFCELVNAWDTTGVGQIMVERVNHNEVEKYGVVDLDGQISHPFKSIRLKSVVEKPTPEKAPSNLAVLGRYVLPPKVMELLEHTEVGVGGEIQLTDALDELLKIRGLNALETDAAVYDCGNKHGFLLANVALGMREPKSKHLLEQFIKLK